MKDYKLKQRNLRASHTKRLRRGLFLSKKIQKKKKMNAAPVVCELRKYEEVDLAGGE